MLCCIVWILGTASTARCENYDQKRNVEMDLPTLPPATPPAPGSMREVQALARELNAFDIPVITRSDPAPKSERSLSDILNDIRKTINQADAAPTEPAVPEPAAASEPAVAPAAATPLFCRLVERNVEVDMRKLAEQKLTAAAEASSSSAGDARDESGGAGDESDESDATDEDDRGAADPAEVRQTSFQEELFEIGNVFIDAMMLPADEAIELKHKHATRHTTYLELETQLGCEAIQLDHLEMQKAKKSPARKACEQLAFVGLVLAVGTVSTVVTAVVALRVLGF